MSGSLDSEGRLMGTQLHGEVARGENLGSPNEVTTSLWGHKNTLAERKSVRQFKGS